MGKLIIKSIIFFYILTTSVLTEVAEKVLITGNERISEETVLIYGDITSGKNYSDKDLDLILKNLYETNFFENVKVNLSNNILKIDLKEYPVINQLIISGENSKRYQEQIKKIIFSKANGPYVTANLAKDVQIINNLYSSIGYNSPSIETKIKKIDDKNFDLLIQIDRGEKTKINSIKFTGNEKIRNSRLKDIIASEEDAFWKIISKNTYLSENLINLDKRLLINYYKSLGFYNVKIESSYAQVKENNSATINYQINEGQRFRINKISAEVDEVFDKKIFSPLKSSFNKLIGEYYSPFKVKNLLEDLDELIEKNNLQFVEHNVKENIENDQISIVLNIFESEKSLVERINITGNNVTNESVIRGELILDEGDPFAKLNLDKSIANIKSRNIFKKVDYEVVNGSSQNQKIINIDVEERPTGEIAAGAGIGTDGGSFAFTVTENNWLGTGNALGFEVEVDSESLSGVLNYSKPNYNFLGNSMNYYIMSESNDKPDQGYENSIIAGGISTSFEQYKNLDINLGLNASYDDLRTDNTASSALKKQDGSFEELAGTYGFTYDKRDRSFMPTRGAIYSFTQNLPIYADKSSISNTYASSHYKSFSDNVVGAGKIYISTINSLDSDDVRLSKRKNLSSKRLRGFERNKVGPKDGKDHVGGNYAAALNFEANLPNLLPEDTNTDISLFLDFGNLWGVDYDSSIDESNKIRSSTGFMANWMSPIGPMNFVISQNLSKADTDETESFKFNLGTTF